VTSVFDDPQFNARLFFPRRDVTSCPPGAKDSFIKVGKVKLHTRTYAPPPPILATLLLFHGNGEMVSDYDDLVPEFLELGLEVVVFDYRGYGKSDGHPTFRTMLSDAIVQVQGTPRSRRRILFGRSLGAACAAEVASRHPPLIDALVLESGGSSIDSLVERRGMPVQTWSEEELVTFDPKPKLARCTVPTLVLHGAEDHVIPVHEAEAAYRALGSERKRLAVIPGRGHNDVSFSDAYWLALRSWVASLG
jgi:alpha-beta hydrolase superfamily lysophospholipase